MNTKKQMIKPTDEFSRNVIFLEDNDTTIAVFPFFHEVSDEAFEQMIIDMSDMDLPDEVHLTSKKEICLLYENEFGWGWIQKEMIPHLNLSSYTEYKDLKNKLLKMKFIKDIFILNMDAINTNAI